MRNNVAVIDIKDKNLKVYNDVWSTVHISHN